LASASFMMFEVECVGTSVRKFQVKFTRISACKVYSVSFCFYIQVSEPAFFQSA